MADCVLLMVRSVKVRPVFFRHGALTVLILTVFAVAASANTNTICDGVKCVHGTCQNVTQSRWTCMCDQGWDGNSCDTCLGRVKLVAEEGKEGVITDGVGNYSLDVKCSWIITGTPGVPIRLRVWQFATECSWDHLYVYDGDSVYSPLIAAFSGLMVFKKSQSQPEITAQSGSAYLHFYSDAAYNMSGFNITFKQGTCPLDCSGNGQCLRSGRCKCEEGWKGDGCDELICPSNCSYHGYCHPTDQRCYCVSGYTGIDCSIEASRGHWESLGEVSGDGQASHTAVVVGQYMWIVGGYTFNEVPLNVTRFNMAANTHDVIELSTQTRPLPRHSHSVVVYQDHLYMYGGLLGGAIITDELWEFDLVSNEWTQIDLEFIKHAHPESTYFATSGHTAHVIDNTMYVIFGHSTVYGYLNTVQECNMENFVWTVPSTAGAIIKGGYGHSSVYDPGTLLIYIHGGYHSASVSSYHLSDSLYAYNPKTRIWKILRSSGEFKYLHTAVILNGLMLVFGGNTHNDTTTSHGATCYSVHFLAYDIDCDQWHSLNEPNLAYNVARYGHTAVAFSNKMFVFGGFNGLLLRDLLVYKPGMCNIYNKKSACLASRQGIRCAWANDARCLSLTQAKQQRRQKTIDTFEPPVCEPSTSDPKRGCEELPTKTCPSCVANSLHCIWCDGQCSQDCSSMKKATTVLGCHKNFTRMSSVCPTLHNCHACRSNAACMWSLGDNKCHLRIKSPSDSETLSKCPVPCNTHTTCENCTIFTCMWCSNERRCVESNSYVVSFLYGQCMEWTTMQSKCPATRCSEMRTCHECKMAPSCGWCNDASDTGLGICMTGGATGPTHQGSMAVVSSNTCPSERWFFTHCPLCLCNGHSVCHPGTDRCDSCSALVTGPQCQYCKDGYWGTATNGGNCTACDCEDQADTCNRLTGTCDCHTRGVLGKHCDTCDDKYYGNPKDGGTCYYELVTDYQFTFNLSKKEDAHYTHINFMNTPVKSDHDVDFTVNCSGHAYINITVVSSRLPSETYILTEFKCHYLSTKFSHKMYTFGGDSNTTFFVYVYDFSTPFQLQISFSQFPQIDLIHFFITFFSCFLSLLVLALVFWKLKQKYDSYRREQRRKLMLKQRAKRPAGTCAIDATSPYCSLMATEPPDLLVLRRHRPSKPSPVALEPMMNHKAAALSLLIRLPTGDEDYTPPGVSGLCIGTALVTLGSHRKLSVEHAKPSRAKKPSVTSENCV